MQRHVVWYDGPIVLKHCPVLYLTPEAVAMNALFERTHECRPTGFGPPWWQLIALPDAGGIADQDAWTMEALAFIRDVRNRVESDRQKERERTADAGAPEAVTANAQ